MEKVGFSWTTPILCVKNLPSSLTYYENVLGFDITWAWSETEAFEGTSPPTFACVTRGEISLFLCENGQGNPGSWVYLNVRDSDELDQVFTELQNNAADIIQEPTDYSWGMRELIAKDIDGNTFRIGCSNEASCDGGA